MVILDDAGFPAFGMCFIILPGADCVMEYTAPQTQHLLVGNY